MRTLATEITPGTRIKQGNRWFKVIGKPTQSSDADKVQIAVEAIAGTIRRRDGFVQKLEGGFNTTVLFRKTTMVQTQ